MRKNRVKICAAACLLMIFAGALIMETNVMAQNAVYSVKTASGRKITVLRSGSGLTLKIDGANGKTLSLKATGGGVSACRTIIEHDSDKANVILSLPIPSPRARCRALPGSVSIESNDANWAIDEANVRRVSGNDSRLRSQVREALGTIDEGEL